MDQPGIPSEFFASGAETQKLSRSTPQLGATGFTQVGIMRFFIELSVGRRAPPFSLGEKVAGDSPPDEGFAPKAHCFDPTLPRRV